jgi:hypothetical protein
MRAEGYRAGVQDERRNDADRKRGWQNGFNQGSRVRADQLQQAYKAGYNTGFENGLTDYASAESKGYEKGLAKGRNTGHAAGVAQERARKNMAHAAGKLAAKIKHNREMREARDESWQAGYDRGIELSDKRLKEEHDKAYVEGYEAKETLNLAERTAIFHNGYHEGRKHTELFKKAAEDL